MSERLTSYVYCNDSKALDSGGINLFLLTVYSMVLCIEWYV